MKSRAKSYVNYLLKAKNRHGIHSPFVYAYVTHGLGQNPDPADWNIWRSFRAELRSNNERIQVEDFGAGSKVMRPTDRKVSQIARTAGISSKRGRLLYNTIRYFKPQSILEIGTSLGMATSIMSLAAPESRIVTLEGCRATAGVASGLFQKFNMSNINAVIGRFENTLPSLASSRSFDLVYLDGNHQKDATDRYFEILLPQVHEKTLFIFDDIHWSPGMEEAWRSISAHPKVTCSIDSYQWGMTFFRKGMTKEHFTLRL